MPIVSVAIELTARNFSRVITAEEFLTPLNIQPGEVEDAWVNKAPWGSSAVRISSCRNTSSRVLKNSPFPSERTVSAILLSSGC